MKKHSTIDCPTKMSLRIATIIFLTLTLFACATAPSEVGRETNMTIVYVQGSLPTNISLISAGANLGPVGATIELNTDNINRGNIGLSKQLYEYGKKEPVLQTFKKSFLQIMNDKGVQLEEIQAKEMPRIAMRERVISFDPAKVKTRWVIQIEEVQTRYSAASMFNGYVPWVWVKFALFDMQDKNLTPIFFLWTKSTTGNDSKYHYSNSEALAKAKIEDLYKGLQDTIKRSAAYTANQIKP